MSEDTKKREIGTSIYPNHFEFFKWKIPNVSSIPHRVDYVLQSPSFSFGDATWVLKMYPYGQVKYETAGYIDVIIERLHSKHKSNGFNCIMDCENAFKKEMMPICGKYSFDSEWPQAKILRFMQNLKECPEKCQISPNDTFSLIFGFERLAQVDVEHRRAGLQIESGKTTVGKIYTASERNESQEIGELIKIHTVLANFTWKVCMERHLDENGHHISFPFPKDYQVQSKPFNLDKASWIFKLYPYFRIKWSRKHYYDVVLKRLHSEIPEHHITLKMTELPNEIERSFVFNSCKTRSDIISFQMEGKNFRKQQCLHFGVEIFIRKDLGVESNPMEIVKPAIGTNHSKIACSISRKRLQKSASAMEEVVKLKRKKKEDSPEQTLEQKPESSATTFRGSNSTSKDPVSLSDAALTDLKDIFLKQEN